MTLKDEELKGKRFGMLTLLYRSGKNKWNDPIFRFKCDCGVEKDILYGSVRRGGTISCGCYNKTKSIGVPPTTKTHGMSKTHDYRIWSSLKNRCYNKNDKDYENYGKRGIKVCDRWLNSFENFYEDMGPRPSLDYSIERQDVNGNYEPNNCFWLLKELQARNRRNSLWIEFQGKNRTLGEWSELLGIKHSTLHKRLFKYNWSVEKAFSTDPHLYHEGKTDRISKRTCFLNCFGITYSLKTWSEMSGIKRSTILARIKRGWSPEKAVITPVKETTRDYNSNRKSP